MRPRCRSYYYRLWLLPDSIDEEKENILDEARAPLSLMSPKNIVRQVMAGTNSTDKAGLIFTIPALSFDVEDLVEANDEAVLSSVPYSYFHDVSVTYNKRFVTLKEKWAKAFQEIESNYLVMAGDIKSLEVVTNDLVAATMQPSSTPSTLSSNLWTSISHVYQLT
jgi:hypothetical protein